MIKAAIFDMDGLMINTEPLQSLAYAQVLKDYGKTPSYYPSGVVQKVGVREIDNWELIKQTHDLDEKTDVLVEKRGPIYLKMLRENVSPQPGLLQLIQLLHQHSIPMAVASSSHRHQIMMVLEGLNIQDYFSVIVSGQDVNHGKPDPEIFLKAADKLNVRPTDCIVFEDAQTGVTAGKAAHMNVIAVPNEFTKDQDVSQADKVVPSLEAINWNTLQTI